MDQFIEKFSTKTVAIQGSGWGWLGFNKERGRLEIGTTSNQDPATTIGLVPILGVDVWEHAYYLQYKNVRADYVKKIWEIVNWKNVAERYEEANSAK
jgi:Fe-Mn family superoxide dismutase